MRSLKALYLLWRSELPLTKDEEELVFPPLIAGIFRVQLYKSPTPSLEVVYSLTSGILLDPVQVHKFLHRELVLFTQNKWPQHHATKKYPTSIRDKLARGQP